MAQKAKFANGIASSKTLRSESKDRNGKCKMPDPGASSRFASFVWLTIITGIAAANLSLLLRTPVDSTMAPDPKKRKAAHSGDAKDLTIAELSKEVADLKQQLIHAKNYDTSVYASELALLGPECAIEIPDFGRNPRHVKE